MANYPYFELPSTNGTILKPLIGIHLSNPKTHKVTSGIYALVDSGADVCFCNTDIGTWLGITYKKQKSQIFTAANNTQFTAIKEILNIFVGNKEFLAPIYFTSNLPKQTPIILGQIGFFDHFKVTFDLQNKSIGVI